MKMAIPLLSWTMVTALALSAAADPEPEGGDNAAVAALLFEEGRQLMKEGQYERACDKFAKSYALDPSVGALLNEATCREARGQTATAWRRYQQAERAARKKGDKRRARAARERARGLVEMLSYLTIVVPEAHRVSGLSIRSNGQEIAETLWGQRLPMDPGSYEVQASADGRQTWTRSVAIQTKRAHMILEVPALEELVDKRPDVTDTAGAEAAEGGDRSASGASEPRPPESIDMTGVDQDRPRSSDAPWTLGRKSALVSGMAGTALLMTAGVLSMAARARYDDARALCDRAGRCDAEGARLGATATSLGHGASAATAVGVCAIGAGVALWLMTGHKNPRPGAERQAGFTPTLTRTGLGVQVHGNF